MLNSFAHFGFDFGGGRGAFGRGGCDDVGSLLGNCHRKCAQCERCEEIIFRRKGGLFRRAEVKMAIRGRTECPYPIEFHFDAAHQIAFHVSHALLHKICGLRIGNAPRLAHFVRQQPIFSTEQRVESHRFGRREQLFVRSCAMRRVTLHHETTEIRNDCTIMFQQQFAKIG